MDGIVLVAPIGVALVRRVPEAAFGGGLVEAALELPRGLAVAGGVGFVAQEFFQAGPETECPIHLGVDQGVLVGGPDNVDPIAAARLPVRTRQHFHQAIVVGIAPEQILKNFFASGLLPLQPSAVGGEVEQLGHVDDPAWLRIQQVSHCAS